MCLCKSSYGSSITAGQPSVRSTARCLSYSSTDWWTSPCLDSLLSILLSVAAGQSVCFLVTLGLSVCLILSSSLGRFVILIHTAWRPPSYPESAQFVLYSNVHSRQESWAIAKTTARCAQYMGALKSFESPWVRPRQLFKICNGLLFRSILRVCVQNLKFVASPVPEIKGGTQKIWAVPGYAHAPFSPKFFMGLCLDGSCECISQICSLSVTKAH